MRDVSVNERGIALSRKYTNNKGEQISVSQEHLDVALRIVDELQKASPSRRCSWPVHKRMMVKEGFEDSSTCEGYRQMIKFERSKRGTLPTINHVLESSVENKIQAIRDEIGNIHTAKLEARDDFNRLSRMKREWSRELLIAESIERAIRDIEINIPERVVNKKPDKNRTIIVGLSDLHYGALVDIEGHRFNASICYDLAMKYANKVIDIIEREGITEAYIVGMGDIIENIYMRHTQSYTAEMSFSEQVAGISQLIIEFIEMIAVYVPVKYAAFNGNHDRLNTKDDTIYGDGAVHLSNEIIKTYLRATRTDRIEFIDTEPYHHIVRLNGFSFLFEHGDKTPMKKKSVLAERQQLYSERFDALICGHIHHFTQSEVGDNQFVVTFGSIKGSDDYSLKTVGVTSSRSQGVIIVDDNDYEIRRVKV